MRPAGPRECGARCRVLLLDGRVAIAVCRWPKGHPDNLLHAFAAHSADVAWLVEKKGVPGPESVPCRVVWTGSFDVIDLRDPRPALGAP